VIRGQDNAAIEAVESFRLRWRITQSALLDLNRQ
jgi:hypothetical protein